MEYPKFAKFKRDNSIVYSMSDFNEGENIEFCKECEKSGTEYIGNVWYKSTDRNTLPQLINVKELCY